MNESNPRPPKRSAGAFGMGLLGVIVGALIVLAFTTLTTNPPVTSSPNTPSNEQKIEQVRVDVQDDVIETVKKVTDTVVGVTNVQTIRDFWSASEMTQEAGTGSGVVYKIVGEKAYIVSNHHVVEGAEALEITFDDGSSTEGKIVGSDMWTDLAVIEIDRKLVKHVATFGDSDTLQRGETVIAIGNPLGLGFSGSVTVGVISGKDRSIPVDFNRDGQVDWHADVLQTDAAINPGNSGGALINRAGQLIGINSMKISQETVEGIGLAIPINLAIPVIESLEATGKVNRPTMGVALVDLALLTGGQRQEVLKIPEAVKEGVVVQQVQPHSPAQKAGIQMYDVITALNGEKITDMVSLRKYLYTQATVGETIQVELYRHQEKMTVDLVLEGEPAL